MKKFVAALLALTMVLALVSTAFAYVDKPLENGEGILVQFKGSAWGYKKVTNNYGKSKSSVALRKGSIANAVAIKGNWYKIQIPKRGKTDDFELLYFNKKYIKPYTGDRENPFLIYSSGGSGRSIAQDDEMDIADYNSKFAKATKVKVNSGRRTNVRSSASLAGKSLGVVGKGHSIKTLKLHKDKVVGFDNRGVAFFKVIYKGNPAWVSEQYVTPKK